MGVAQKSSMIILTETAFLTMTMIFIGLAPYLLLFLLMIMFIILGCFLDSISDVI